MTARRKGIIAAAVVVGLLAWGGYRFHQFSRETRAEYHTAQTIDKVATFVETHQGRWPRSWDELGGPDYWRDGDVRIDFQADPDRLIDDPQLIYEVITPYTGTYRIYPHAKVQLDELRSILIKTRRRPQEPSP